MKLFLYFNLTITGAEQYQQRNNSGIYKSCTEFIKTFNQYGEKKITIKTIEGWSSYPSLRP